MFLVTKLRALPITAAVGAVSMFLLLESPAATAQDADNDGLRLEEITVTARRREENLQDVPVAISVLSSDELAERGAVNINAVGQITPNVHFENAQPSSGVKSPMVFIRGIGQDDFIIVEDPAVGVYLDGVFLGRTVGSALDLVDVERVEVLRGPQGTLFGRNTIGGAINIVSKKPHDEFEANVKLGVGEDGYFEGRVALNVPLGEVFAARMTAFTRERDGYVRALQYDDYLLGSDDMWGARVNIAGDISDSFSISFAADVTSANETPSAMSTIGGVMGIFNGGLQEGPGQPGTFGNFWNALFSGDAASCTTAAGQASNPACVGQVYNTNTPYASNGVYTDFNGNQIEAKQDFDIFGANLTMEWDFGAASLKSITAYREFDVFSFNDLDFTPHIVFGNTHPEYSQDQFSQELQVLGTAMDDRLKYVVGLYYFEETGLEDIFNQIAHPISSGPPAFFFQQLGRNIDNDSTAIFGQFTYDINDRWHVTAGGRYTESNKSFFMDTERVATFTRQSGDLSQEEFSPMVSLSWDASDDIMTFLTYSKGFRDGGYPARFTGAVPDPLPNYNPEFVTNYELGMKSTLVDGRVRLNASIFQMDYEDMQISATTPATGVGDNTTKFNLGESTIRGAEIEFSAAVTDRFTFDASIGLLDAEIDSLVGGFLVSSGITIETDHDIPFTPDSTIALSGRYQIPFNSGADLTLRADWYQKDDYYSRAENIPETLETDHQQLNLAAVYTAPDGRWRAGAVVTNATDEVYYQSRRLFAAFAQVYGQPVRPRTGHVWFEYNFGAN